jgi:hypothetical protein
MIDSFVQRAYPEYNFRIPVIRRANGSIEFGDYSFGFTPTPQSVEWFMSLDGSLTVGQASALGADQLNIAQSRVTSLLDHGFRSGALLDARNKPRTTRWLNASSRGRTHTDLACVQKNIIDYADNFHIKDAAEIVDRRTITQIELVGDGPVARAIYQLGLDSGFQFTRSRSLASIVIFVSQAHPHVFQHVNSHLCSIPHLHVGARLDSAEIGPLVLPGESSCFRCAHLHRCDASPDWMEIDLQWRHHANSGQSDSILVYQTAAYTLLLLRHWIDGAAMTEITNTAWSAKLPWLHFRTRKAPPHPLCGCLNYTCPM